MAEAHKPERWTPEIRAQLEKHGQAQLPAQFEKITKCLFGELKEGRLFWQNGQLYLKLTREWWRGELNSMYIGGGASGCLYGLSDNVEVKSVD